MNVSTSVSERRFLTLREAAAVFGLSERTLRRYVEARVVPVVQPAGRGFAIRIDEAELERLLGGDQVSAVGPSSAADETAERRAPAVPAVARAAARGDGER